MKPSLVGKSIDTIDKRSFAPVAISEIMVDVPGASNPAAGFSELTAPTPSAIVTRAEISPPSAMA